MSELCRKYDLSEETLKNMVTDGVISTSWTGCDEIYSCYKKLLATSKNITEAVNLTAEEKGVSVGLVYKSIHRFE